MFVTCSTKILVTARTIQNAKVQITYFQAVCVTVLVAALQSSSCLYIDMYSLFSEKIHRLLKWGMPRLIYHYVCLLVWDSNSNTNSFAAVLTALYSGSWTIASSPFTYFSMWSQKFAGQGESHVSQHHFTVWMIYLEAWVSHGQDKPADL
jgi:hypothetical protein